MLEFGFDGATGARMKVPQQGQDWSRRRSVCRLSAAIVTMRASAPSMMLRSEFVNNSANI